MHVLCTAAAAAAAGKGCVLRTCVEDLLHVIHKAHVEHLITLIKHPAATQQQQQRHSHITDGHFNCSTFYTACKARHVRSNVTFCW
jgi:hypothetical protein